MSPQLFASVVDSVVELGGSELDFTGGEPFLHKDVWTLLENALDKKLEIGLATNATHCSREDALHLKELGVGFVWVSVHGSPASHDALTGVAGSWRRAIQWCSQALEEGLELGWNVYLEEPSVDEALSLLDAARKLGVTRIRFLYHCPTGRGRDTQPNREYNSAWIQIRDALRRIEVSDCQVMMMTGVWPVDNGEQLPAERRSFFCNLDTNFSGVVEADGTVYSCCALVHSDEYRLGVFPDTPLRVLQREHLKRFTEYLDVVPSECDGCPMISTCRGGCPAYRQSPQSRDSRCRPGELMPLCPAAHEHF